MRKFYRVILVVSLLCYFVAGSGIIAFASGNIGNISTEPITTMTEPRARTAVLGYFEERKAFLTKQADDIPMAIDTLEADEVKHLQHLEANSISYLSYSLEFESIDCWDSNANVVVTEIASFLIGSETKVESINHEMRLDFDPQGNVRVRRNGYKEDTTNFLSCGYVIPQSAYELNSVTPGSSSCIVAQACTQVGYSERADGYTKYGAEYAARTSDNSFTYTDWCTTFIMWCAYHSNVSNSVIPLYGSTTLVRNWYTARGLYKVSKNYGGTYTPKAGDLILFGAAVNDSDHIGLVVSANSQSVRYIEGNQGGYVLDTTESLTEADIIGFATPIYESTGHTPTVYSNSEVHWTGCSNCSYMSDIVYHSFSMLKNSINHWQKCSVCNYTTTDVAHIYAWDYDINYHWRFCTVCYYEQSNIAHTYAWQSDVDQHWQQCTSCGRRKSTAAHLYMEEGPEYYICYTCGRELTGVTLENLAPHYLAE